MNKIFHVALRELVSTVTTKAFILGVILPPLLIGLMAYFMPRLFNQNAPKVDGVVAVVDPTGTVAVPLGERLAPEAIARRRGDMLKPLRQMAPVPLPTGAVEKAMAKALGEVPELTIEALPATVSLEEAKEPLLPAARNADDEASPHLALVVIHEDAVLPPDGGNDYGSYDLFVRPKLDDRITDEIRNALVATLVEERIRARELDPEVIRPLVKVKRVSPVEVSAEGERESSEIFNMLLPLAFMGLLLISVMVSGQQLMTTTIEEKSSRVVEVLLSAVSPMELMTGKILGQLAVSSLILVLYASLGVVLLVAFTLFGLIDPWLFLYMGIFYLIAYFIIASLMAAIGAAVNDVREAQSLLMPVMMIVMLPWMLWMPISRDPNSTLATVLSLVPPINPFVMMLRMASLSPPPLWQVWLSILIGLVAVLGSLWLAAKVFRVGLLMFGKAPSLRTLLRWVRMA